MIYHASVKTIESRIFELRRLGRPAKEIAEAVVDLRIKAKIDARKLMRADDVKVLEARNMTKYNDPIGPTVEWYLENGKSYDYIIESATSSNRLVDWLFFVF